MIAKSDGHVITGWMNGVWDSRWIPTSGEFKARVTAAAKQGERIRITVRSFVYLCPISLEPEFIKVVINRHEFDSGETPVAPDRDFIRTAVNRVEGGERRLGHERAQG